MDTQDYFGSFNAGVSPAEAIQNICNVTGWWSRNLTGKTHEQEDIFTVRFGKTWATMKISELIPEKKVVWDILECHLDLLKDKEEWKDTKIIFSVSREDSQIKVSMTHFGLVPALECYVDCTGGWNFYIKDSLFSLTTTGKGKPGVGIRVYINKENKVYEGIMYCKNDPLPLIETGDLIFDVYETKAEEVVSWNSAFPYDAKTFNFNQLEGEHFMIVPGATIGTDELKNQSLKTTK